MLSAMPRPLAVPEIARCLQISDSTSDGDRPVCSSVRGSVGQNLSSLRKVCNHSSGLSRLSVIGMIRANPKGVKAVGRVEAAIAVGP